MNLTKPYFPSTRYVDPRTFDPVYNNTKCLRCKAPKAIATETTCCPPCALLPCCDICGDFEGECDCADYEPCKGCEDGCGECSPSMARRYNSHYFDRERWGYDG